MSKPITVCHICTFIHVGNIYWWHNWQLKTDGFFLICKRCKLINYLFICWFGCLIFELYFPLGKNWWTIDCLYFIQATRGLGLYWSYIMMNLMESINFQKNTDFKNSHKCLSKWWVYFKTVNSCHNVWIISVINFHQFKLTR